QEWGRPWLSATKLFDRNFIDVTPFPVFARFHRAHERMTSRMKVLRRMFIFGGIAATDVPAGEAHAEMNPGIAGFKTVFAPLGAGFYIVDFFQMRTVRHTFSTLQPFYLWIVSGSSRAYIRKSGPKAALFDR